MKSTQLELEANIPPSDIPSGTEIPMAIFQKYLSASKLPQIFLELGCGTGEKAKQIHNKLNALVLGIDINPKAVEIAFNRGLVAVTGDARKSDLAHHDKILQTFHELYSIVYMEGLLCNQIDGEWKDVLDTCDQFAMPTGHIMFSEVVLADVPNPFFEKAVSEFGIDFQFYLNEWKRRYDANKNVLKKLGDQNPERGQIIVTRPGAYKQYEWGNAETLLNYVYGTENLERWALHLDPGEVIKYAKEKGWVLVHSENQVPISRLGEPLNGWLAVFQKPDIFKYNQIYKGKKILDVID